MSDLRIEPYRFRKAEKVRKEMESDKEATIKRVADAIEAEFMNPLNLKLSEDDLRVKFAKAAIAAYETK